MKKSVGFLIILFIAVIVVNAWSIVSLLDQHNIYNEASQNNILSVETVEKSNAQMQMLSIVQLVLYFLVFVSFCLWFYGVHEDLESFGVKDLKYSHGQTFWGFIVPVINIVRPYRIANEIWIESSLDEGQRKKSLIVLLWWSCVILSTLFGYASGAFVAFSDDVETFKNSILLLTVADGLVILASIFAFSMIRNIEKKQKQRYAAN